MWPDHRIIYGKKLSFTITGFNRTIKDVIVYGPQFTYENRDKQHDFGAELELSYAPNSHLNFKASYAYIDGEITQNLAGKDTSYYNLTRRPKNTVTFFAGYQLSRQFYISTSIQFIGKRRDNYYDPITYIPAQADLKAYTMWNAYAEYKLAKNKLSVFADTKNLLDNSSFYEVYGYSVPGINITAGVRFTL